MSSSNTTAPAGPSPTTTTTTTTTTSCAVCSRITPCIVHDQCPKCWRLRPCPEHAFTSPASPASPSLAARPQPVQHCGVASGLRNEVPEYKLEKDEEDEVEEQEQEPLLSGIRAAAELIPHIFEECPFVIWEDEEEMDYQMVG